MDGDAKVLKGNDHTKSERNHGILQDGSFDGHGQYKGLEKAATGRGEAEPAVDPRTDERSEAVLNIPDGRGIPIPISYEAEEAERL